MTNVTEKAQKACSLTWKEGGNVTVLWVDTNERTGEVRVRAGRVGEERNGFRHGSKHHCVAIGTQEACRCPRPNERRIADRSDVFDPDPNETRRTPWDAY